jgi:hypothetical protein
MKATAKIIPGIAYPDIEKILKLSKILLLESLFPKFIKKAKDIKIRLAKTTNNNVLKFNEIIFVSCKYFGNFTVQYIIWLNGNKKLRKNNTEQKVIGNIDFLPFKSIFGILRCPVFEF